MSVCFAVSVIKHLTLKRHINKQERNFIIILIIIIIISFMEGIYTYTPETNHVPREYSVSANIITIYGAYIASSCIGTIVLLR